MLSNYQANGLAVSSSSTPELASTDARNAVCRGASDTVVVVLLCGVDLLLER